jgi:hypothetical protein
MKNVFEFIMACSILSSCLKTGIEQIYKNNIPSKLPGKVGAYENIGMCLMGYGLSD